MEDNKMKTNEQPVPEGFRDRLERTLEAAAAASYVRREEKRAAWRLPVCALAAAAALAAVIVVGPGKEPSDTFNDPLQAYAELEKTIGFISEKMDKGLMIASEIRPVMEKTSETINKIK